MLWSVQRVVPPSGGEESWTVLDPAYDVVAPVERFLAHLAAIERSPGTVRSYAFDLRDYFTFLGQMDVSWQSVRLEDLGRFVAWLRLPPAERAGGVTRLGRVADYCSASTINRKLSAVGSFHEFHQRHGVESGFFSTAAKTGRPGSWRPLLAHLGVTRRPRRVISLRPEKKVPARCVESLAFESGRLVIGRAPVRVTAVGSNRSWSLFVPKPPGTLAASLSGCALRYLRMVRV